MTSYVLAGGCFWCLDAVYRRIKGVEKVTSGYTGGDAVDPSYYQVVGGDTGHAESVEVVFDESIIPVGIILDLFFLVHDPTTLNRQGADVGTQYRSAMFYADDSQKKDFIVARDKAQKLWEDPIVTEISQLKTFYAAEDDHQNFYQHASSNPYCVIVIDPKISKVRSEYNEWFKED
jgi:peptide-methionine (S)-S-oxide reductase